MYTEKKVIHRAGTIPYIIEDGHPLMMFMKPSNPEFGGDAFQIAKGRLEDGESSLNGALREAKEELGLFIGNVLLTEEVGTFMGRTVVYVSKIKSRDMFGLPDEETGDIAWMTLEQFLNDGRSLHHPVVQAAHRKIVKIEGL